jgi:GntR family transcriptional regulator
LDVSRLTVRRALDVLAQDGVVARVQGSGTFVQTTTIRKSVELTSFTRDMLARGLTPGSEAMSLTLASPDGRAREALGLQPDDTVVKITRVRTANGVPVCIERVQIPALLVPGLENGLTSASLYDELDHRFGLRLARADQTIEGVAIDLADAHALAVAPATAGFRTRRVAFVEKGHAVEYTEAVYRGDRYTFSFSLTAPSSE